MFHSFSNSKLDFIHFSECEVNLIGRETRVLSYRKDDHALLADRLHQCHWHLCPCLFQTGLATRDSPPHRRHPCPGPRTVTAMLQIMGLSAASDVQTYHRVLNRAMWSPLTASRLLLRLVVAVFIPRGVVIFGLDDPIARRRGQQIQAKGLDRDPVRSSTHMWSTSVACAGSRGWC